eukprot:CAMPEP_0194536116 /NCGR_PEP_ID=MMETSP0253-20130528/74916_1 /TAXON_ID=2966 /ORGANISM="Noctiluca scintillans" /LENGTH=62 /DNA_ID=CAMNT_0039381995 /DNA_START=6 /DNA_END=191 /DNA_ORIENTATION=-
MFEIKDMIESEQRVTRSMLVTIREELEQIAAVLNGRASEQEAVGPVCSEATRTYIWEDSRSK